MNAKANISRTELVTGIVTTFESDRVLLRGGGGGVVVGDAPAVGGFAEEQGE